MSRVYDHRITEMTVGALMDLGYPAAWYGAGPYLDDVAGGGSVH